jgi:hypothetical protein
MSAGDAVTILSGIKYAIENLSLYAFPFADIAKLSEEF